MKLTVLHDPEGVILAAVASTGRNEGPVPVASDGNKVGTFDVPPTAVHLGLDKICTSFRVDVASRRLIEAKAGK
jgi:hypothetical protein